MSGPTHADLVALGAKWLRKQGFPVVATELVAAGCKEFPDVIGFRSICSAVVEAKSSRADFLADKAKPHRSDGTGMGLYRFFLTPAGVAQPDEVPARWGLLHAEGQRVVEVLRPKGNLWPGPGGQFVDWLEFQHPFNSAAERQVLFSIARRSAAR
jgi:hypothetical protein